MPRLNKLLLKLESKREDTKKWKVIDHLADKIVVAAGIITFAIVVAVILQRYW